MSNEFLDALRSASAGPSDATLFQGQLRLLAEAIEARYPWLTAQAVLESLAPGLTPVNVLILRVSAKGDNRLSWDAVSFRVDGPDQISLLGGRQIGTIDQFRAYLHEMIRIGALRTSLEMLNVEAIAPYAGELRTVDPNTLAANDVAVRLTRAEYDSLEGVAEPKTIAIHVAAPHELAPLQLGVIKYSWLTVQGGSWPVLEQPSARPDGTFAVKVGPSSQALGLG